MTKDEAQVALTEALVAVNRVEEDLKNFKKTYKQALKAYLKICKEEVLNG